MGGGGFLGWRIGMLDLEGSLRGSAFESVFLGGLNLVTGCKQQGEESDHKNPCTKSDFAHGLKKIVL